MVGDNKYEISQRAYVKIVLHALKHQCSAVNGVLIGKVTGAGLTNEQSSSRIEIVDAIPLFHGQLGLLPMLELALTQVFSRQCLVLRAKPIYFQAYEALRRNFWSYDAFPPSRVWKVEEYLTAENENLVIAGYYHANERFEDYELSPLARKIGDQIARYCPPAGVLLLDNRLLGSLEKGGSKKPVVQLYTRDPVRGWRVGGDLTLKEATANRILTDYISEKREQLVVDFDDHLYDVSKDWLNPNLYN